MTASAPPRPSAVEVVPSIGSTAMSAFGGVPSPIRSPLKSIGRVVLLAFADDNDAVHGDGGQHDAHGVDRRTVRPVLVAPPHPTGRGECRGLGHADEFHGQIAVRCLRGGVHAHRRYFLAPVSHAPGPPKQVPGGGNVRMLGR